MISKLRALLLKVHSDERGLSTVEYVVLLVLIVAMAVAAWRTFGSTVLARLGTAQTGFQNEVTTAPAAAPDPAN